MFGEQRTRHTARWALCTTILLGGLTQAPVMAAPAADLDQIRNSALDECGSGDPCPGSTCTYASGKLQWVNGNAGAETAHYAEGMSIAYRVRMTEVPTGKPITITLGYDIKHSDHHAIDYLTHFQRLEFHCAGFDHAAEIIDPRVGVAAVSGSPLAGDDTFPILAPSSTGSPVAGQPTASFNGLPAAERVMTIYNGDLTNVTYATQGSLTANQSETRINVTFIANNPTVVLAWGGHIASRLDWGFGSDGKPRSAAGISGSPYHMRLISWTWTIPPKMTNLGNQDRSLSAAAVIPPPTGACCIGTACSIRSQADCEANGGHYQGDVSVCVAGLCGCTITCPDNTTVECGGYDLAPGSESTQLCTSPPSPAKSVTGTATCTGESCTATYTDSCVSACGKTGTITRHWTCSTTGGGASASCDQTITVQDSTAPEIDCTADDPVVEDACFAKTVTFHATVTDTCCIDPIGVGDFALIFVGDHGHAIKAAIDLEPGDDENVCTKTSSDGGKQVDVTCKFRISDLPRCGVTVEAAITATDCCNHSPSQACTVQVSGI